MRLLLVGAFPYPHHQGSQVYFQEQAIALRQAGADVELLTYASQGPVGDDLDRWRALDGFLHHKAPAWTAPSGLRSGPSLGKPLADLGLAYAVNAAIASSIASNASYDCVMTHNIEASFVSALCRMTRSSAGPPVVYCIHTMMENELSSYSKWLKKKGITPGRPFSDRMSSRVKRVVDNLGGRLDRFAARSSDGWIALTHSSERVMKSASFSPGELIVPPIPDLRHRFFPIDAEDTCLRHKLVPNKYILYSGNLDAYQEIDQLKAAAQALEHRRTEPVQLPIVIASHDPDVLALKDHAAGLEVRHVETDHEMQGLISVARATITMRRAEGGFPIKLANSLAWGTAPIVFHGREWGLSHHQDAWVADPERPEESLAEAISCLSLDTSLARQLGIGARRRFEKAHAPRVVAARTLALIEEVRLRWAEG